MTASVAAEADIDDSIRYKCFAFHLMKDICISFCHYSKPSLSGHSAAVTVLSAQCVFLLLSSSGKFSRLLAVSYFDIFYVFCVSFARTLNYCRRARAIYENKLETLCCLVFQLLLLSTSSSSYQNCTLLFLEHLSKSTVGLLSIQFSKFEHHRQQLS